MVASPFARIVGRLLEGVFVAGVCLIYATTLLAKRIGYQASQDSHYHFAVAREILAGNLRSEVEARLPWTVLAELPVDHAFGYHAALAPFAMADDPEVGMKLATVALFSAVFVGIYGFLRARRIGYAGIWALLPALFSNQDWRYLMLRGGHWMVILSLLYIHVAFFVTARTKRRLGVLAIAYVAMLSYQGALVLLPLHLGGLGALAILRKGDLRRGDLLDPVIAVLGFALALTLNPYMDAGASTWKYAWFHITYMMGDPANLYPDLREFGPLPLEYLWHNPEFVALPALTIGVAGFWLSRRRHDEPMDRTMTVLLGVALAGILLTARAIRMREYSVPWVFIFLASVAPRTTPSCVGRSLVGALGGALVILGLYLKWPATYYTLRQHLPTYQYRNARPLLESYREHPVLNIAEGDYTTLRWEYEDVRCVQGLSRYFLYTNRPVFDDVWTLRQTTDPAVRLNILRRFFHRGVRLLAVQHRNSVFVFAEAHPSALRLAYRSRFEGAVKIRGSSIYILDIRGIEAQLAKLGGGVSTDRSTQ